MKVKQTAISLPEYGNRLRETISKIHMFKGIPPSEVMILSGERLLFVTFFTHSVSRGMVATAVLFSKESSAAIRVMAENDIEPYVGDERSDFYNSIVMDVNVFYGIDAYEYINDSSLITDGRCFVDINGWYDRKESVR